VASFEKRAGELYGAAVAHDAAGVGTQRAA